MSHQWTSIGHTHAVVCPTAACLVMQFGVCLWEIVTSQMPRRGEIFCPSADACPATVISLIHDCMKYDPVDRPSAKEICRCQSALSPISDLQS